VSRSFLFVPADSERKLAKASSCGADALILDLEDSVVQDKRPRARELAREFLDGNDDAEVWVRINPLVQDDALADLRATVMSGPAGIMLPKLVGTQDADRLSMLLDVLEQEHELPLGSTRIMPITTERAAALFKLHEYSDTTRRVAALTWGAEDLSSSIGASANRDDAGAWLPPYELARSLCLFAAAAAEVPAVDTVYADFRDSEGLAKYASAARRDGFAGMLAIHPDQVAVINEAFLPTPEEVERAVKIVKLFAEDPDAGVLQLDGAMLDRPHLVQAKKILTMAGRQPEKRTKKKGQE
jgi:citrate lyase subunit beta/citryl-CoA lyase